MLVEKYVIQLLMPLTSTDMMSWFWWYLSLHFALTWLPNNITFIQFWNCFLFPPNADFLTNGIVTSATAETLSFSQKQSFADVLQNR